MVVEVEPLITSMITMLKIYILHFEEEDLEW